MAPKIKYVTIEGPFTTNLYMFDDTITHRDFVDRLQVGREDVVGAGFVDWWDVKCYGKSISLGVESTPRDTQLLKRMAGDTDD